MRRFLAAVSLLFTLFALVGCGSEAESIREANERSATMTPEARGAATYSPPTPTPAPSPTPSKVEPASPVPTPSPPIAPTQPAIAPTAAARAEIESVELVAGDCVDSTLPEGISVKTVEIVLCSGPWQYKVLDSFEADDLPQYPGEAYFAQYAFERCDRRSGLYLAPSEDLWDSGNRAVTCLQRSFGLSVIDPAKIDRLVSSVSLRSGECVNSAPETGDMMVELVDCSGPWQFRVLDSFEVADLTRYPGESFFAQLAFERCEPRHSYIGFPLEETWSLGGRQVSCLQDSYGLSDVDPEKLDRLVGIGSLRIGDCLNDAPETNGALMELTDCSAGWEWKVTNVFDVPWDGEYPGSDYFDTQASQNCGELFYYFEPSVVTWEWGDRSVVCMSPP